MHVRDDYMAGYVVLEDVKKVYRMGEVEIKASDGISFDVNEGEFVIVVEKYLDDEKKLYIVFFCSDKCKL